jgi:molybdopterin-guanine dinucleotide biosynthesis protein B
MVPVVSIVGKKNSGKTTLVEKLIKELKTRGYKVATIKHDVHQFDVDHPGTDTWRHTQAGADSVIISSPYRVAIMKQVTDEWTLSQLIDLSRDADIILTEGYKKSDLPKIQVVREARSKEPLSGLENLIATATDTDLVLAGIPSYGLDDAVGLVNLIEKELMSK